MQLPFTKEEWGQPHFFKDIPVPVWPKNTLPIDVENFVREVSISTETPEELSVMIALSVIATASQSKYQVVVKEGYAEPTNIWAVVALPPASRKTSVYKLFTAPLREWEKERKLELEPQIIQAESLQKTIEARLKGLRLQAGKVTDDDEYQKIQATIEKIERDLQPIPKAPQIWASDVTNEQLGVIMSQNDESMSILSDEGGIFDIIGGLYSDGRSNIDLLLQAHSSGPVRVDRGSRPPIFMERATLTMGLTVQPEVIKRLSGNKSYRGRGLIGRFLYVMPRSNIGARNLDAPPIRQEVKAVFNASIKAILNHPVPSNQDDGSKTHSLYLDEKAFSKWLQHARCIESLMHEDLGILSHMTDWAGKLSGAIARIAALIHISRHAKGHPWQHKITLEDMTAAIQIGHALQGHAIIFFNILSENEAETLSRSILRWIGTESKTTFTRREAYKRHSSSSIEQVTESLNVLVEANYLHYCKKKTGGRSSDTYTVNPNFLE